MKSLLIIGKLFKIYEKILIQRHPLLDKDIRYLDMTVRTTNALIENDVIMIGDLIKLRKRDLLLLPRLREKSVREIVELLGYYGLKLADD